MIRSRGPQVREVEPRRARVKDLREAQRRLEKLAQDLDQAEKRVASLPSWPTNEEIHVLRQVVNGAHGPSGNGGRRASARNPVSP